MHSFQATVLAYGQATESIDSALHAHPLRTIFELKASLRDHSGQGRNRMSFAYAEVNLRWYSTAPGNTCDTVAYLKSGKFSITALDIVTGD